MVKGGLDKPAEKVAAMMVAAAEGEVEESAPHPSHIPPLSTRIKQQQPPPSREISPVSLPTIIIITANIHDH